MATKKKNKASGGKKLLDKKDPTAKLKSRLKKLEDRVKRLEEVVGSDGTPDE